MDNKKQEDLQSRREFFKSAAKAALPVMGAVILSQLPISAMAASDCAEWSCTARCESSCHKTCHINCETTCRVYEK